MRGDQPRDSEEHLRKAPTHLLGTPPASPTRRTPPIAALLYQDGRTDSLGFIGLASMSAATGGAAASLLFGCTLWT